MFGFTLLAFLLTPPLFGAGVTVRFTGEPGGEGGRYSRALAEEWAQKTGNAFLEISSGQAPMGRKHITSRTVYCT